MKKGNPKIKPENQIRQHDLFPDLGFGLGLRPDHYSDVLNGRSQVSWFEVVSENYLGEGGRPILFLEKFRENYPIALHGVSLSIGSADSLNPAYLKKLKNLIKRIEPAIVSDHCCWTGVNGENLHDLMPLPYTESTLKHIVEKVKKTQDFLGRRILLENVSSYLAFKASEMSEWEFLTEIANRADCGLLLDLNNVYVNSINHSFNPLDFIKGLPPKRIGQVHLAGHSEQNLNSGRKFLIDTHDHPVCDEVWDLYRASLETFGSTSTMVEWDANIPEYAVLEAEINKAKSIGEQLNEQECASRRLTPIPNDLSRPSQRDLFTSRI